MPSNEKTRPVDSEKTKDEGVKKEETPFDLDDSDIEDIIEEARQHAKKRRKGGQ